MALVVAISRRDQGIGVRTTEYPFVWIYQISLHLGEPFATTRTGRVGDAMVPMPHFGIVLELPAWQAMAERLTAAGTDFVLKPQVRFEGQPGEQWTMFFCDPFGNPIEAKGFRSLAAVYDK